MSMYLADGDDLTLVADAIREKSGGSNQLSFPDGFVSEIESIPSGGYSEDGFVDVIFNDLVFDNDSSKVISGSAYDGNKIVLTTSKEYTRAFFLLRRPIPIVPNDVMKMTISKTGGTTSFSDMYYSISPVSSRTGFVTNFTISANTVLTKTETLNSYDIIGFEMGSRLNTWNNAQLTIHFYVNDVLIF